MKIQDIANSFSEKESPIIIICNQKDIDEIQKEISSITTAANFGEFKNSEETPAKKIGVVTFFFEGKQIHLVPQDKSLLFYQLMLS